METRYGCCSESTRWNGIADDFVVEERKPERRVGGCAIDFHNNTRYNELKNRNSDRSRKVIRSSIRLWTEFSFHFVDVDDWRNTA